MNVIALSPADLAFCASLVCLLALISWRLRLGVEQRLLIAGLRTLVQLILVGYVLGWVFEQRDPWIIAGLMLFMLSLAGYEVWARQTRRFRGLLGPGLGWVAMFLSSFTVTILAMLLVIQPQPWYLPQYLIPLLGMLLGNTMSGVALTLDNLTQQAWNQRAQIEGRLLLGHSWSEAIADIRANALRSGLIPIINGMAAAGLISLPGMMTGQILAGSPPMEAAKYQILIMYLITAGTGFGAMFTAWFGCQWLFDERHRLRLDRLALSKRAQG